MRSPNWHECEVKLAMDLYLNKDIKWVQRMSDKTFEITAFSKLLNGLDFYLEKPENFRSTGSIRMKLANFLALDERYSSNSLGNVGGLDKAIWKEYSNNPQKLHEECIDIIASHLKDKDSTIDEYLERMNLLPKVNCEMDFLRFSQSLNREIAYFEKLAGENPNVQYANQVMEWCRKTKESLKWTEDVEGTINFSQPIIYKEHAGINLKPVKNKKEVKKLPTEDKDEEEKIGKLIQRTFWELVERDKLSDEMIELLQSPAYSKETFGTKPSFLVRIDDGSEIDDKIKDANGYTRYWKKPIEIKGYFYCVTKEWYPNQRWKYLAWLEQVNTKPFDMVYASDFLRVLMYIQKADEKQVSFLRNDICNSFPQLRIEEIVMKLIDMGVLNGFQGSTKELVVDDYDALFRMISNPTDYAME